jgi:hypothetical protein
LKKILGMIPANHLLVGGVISGLFAIVGTILNFLALYVLCLDKELRKNSTTILIIFLSISNFIGSGLGLPLNSASLLLPHYFKDHPALCKFFAFVFFGNYTVMLLMEAALAVNRWVAVCTNHRYTSMVTCWTQASFQVHEPDLPVASCLHLALHPAADLPPAVGLGAGPRVGGGDGDLHGARRARPHPALRAGGRRALPRHLPVLHRHPRHPQAVRQEGQGEHMQPHQPVQVLTRRRLLFSLRFRNSAMNITELETTFCQEDPHRNSKGFVFLEIFLTRAKV